MYSQNKSFQHRLDAVSARKRTHGKRSKVAYSLGPDGELIPVVVKRSRRFPWVTMLFAAVSVVVLKGFVYAFFGAEVMEVRVTGLSQGEWSGQVWAFVMQPDPVSGWAAGWIAPLLSAMGG